MPPIERQPGIDTNLITENLLKDVVPKLPKGILTREQIGEVVKSEIERQGFLEKYGTGLSVGFKLAVISKIYGDQLEPSAKALSLDPVEVEPVVQLTKDEGIPTSTNTSTKPVTESVPLKASSLVEWEIKKDEREEALAKLREKEQLSQQEKPSQGELPL